MAGVFRAHGRLPPEVAELTLYQLDAICNDGQLDMPEPMTDEEYRERMAELNG